MNEPGIISAHDILAAHERIKPFVHCTPVWKSAAIDQIAEADIFFKCENFQKAGAFKIRGASNTILSLSDQELSQGVATHSSGNHAAALSLAARNKGIPAYIVMPDNSSRVKVAAVKSYGGRITFCSPTLSSREETLEIVIDRTKAKEIHPYNQPEIICGQATAALELICEAPDLDIIMAPVGGGGLLSGTALSAHYFSKAIVVAAEPENANDAYQSFLQNRIIPSVNPDTIADGLRTSLGSLTFPIIKEYVSEILLAGELEIIAAMRLIWERMKIIVEPSSAVPLAALMNNRLKFKNKKIGIILSGGNVDFDHLPF